MAAPKNPKVDAKAKEIIFTAPAKGIADSPYIGAADVRNLDVVNIPGIAQELFAAVKKSSTVITGQPMWCVFNNDSAQTAFVVDNANVLYKSDNSSSYTSWSVVTHGSPSSGHGNGLRIWKNYLFLAADTAVDVMKISNGAWTNAWAGFGTLTTLGISSLTTHPMFNSLDDKLYLGDGQFVHSAAEVGTFDPTSAGTYTVVLKAITLPSGSWIRCIEELGINLMLGIIIGQSITSLGNIAKLARIYPWNRTAGGALGIPISLPEAGVHQMLVKNNLLYFQAGLTGRYYVTSGSSSKFLTRIPPYNRASKITASYPGAITSYQGKIQSGITVSGGSSTLSGVYSFDTDGTKLSLQIISSGQNNGNVVIGCLGSVIDLGANDDMLIGWYDGTNMGVDLVGEDNYPASYVSYFDSDIRPVGTSLNKRTFTALEFYLEQALVSGQGIRVSYRLDTSSSFILLGTYDFSSLAGVLTKNRSIKISNAVQLQVRVALTGGAGTPRFKYLILR